MRRLLSFKPILRESTSVARERQLHDSRHELLVWHPCLLRRARELPLSLQVAVGVHLDDVNFTVLRHPEIHPSVVAQSQRRECPHGYILQPLGQVRW